MSVNKRLLLEKLGHIIADAIFEARVLRTIDPKIWATVASGICKKYKNDMGATCKARNADTKEVLLQKYVAALLILKQPCPTTQMGFENGKVFPLWAKALSAQGVTIAQVTALYNQNSGQGTADAQVVDNAIDKQSSVSATPSVPAKPAAKATPAPTPKKATAISNGQYKVSVNLRMLIPSTNGGGYDDTLVEEYTTNGNGDLDIINVVNDVLTTYNTPAKKTKCRDGWYSTYYYIIIEDTKNNVKADIDITRERIVPRVGYTTANGTYLYNNEDKTVEKIYGKSSNKKMNTPAPAPTQKRWKITYDDGDDISSVWVYADTRAEAIQLAKEEYYDIKEIILVNLLKD